MRAHSLLTSRRPRRQLHRYATLIAVTAVSLLAAVPSGHAAVSHNATKTSTAAPATAAKPYRADPTYQVGGVSGAVVRSVLLTPNVIYIGGLFTTVRPPGVAGTDTSQDVPRNNVAAFDRSTGALLPWNPSTDGEVFTLQAVGNDIFMGGEFMNVGGTPETRVAAVDATTGAVDPSINVTASATVFTIVNGPNGNLFLGGSFNKINGQSRSRLAEMTPTGSLVSTWRPNVAQYYGDTTQCPPRCHPEVFTIDFSTDGNTVYFGGHFGLVNGVQRNEGAAVSMTDSTGMNCSTASCVTPWNPSVFAPRNCPTCKQVETSRIYTLHITSTMAYACGGFWRINYNSSQTTAVTRYNVAAFNLTDGTVVPRTTFDAEDDGDTVGCGLRNGILYIGGHFNYVGAPCPCNSTNAVTRHHVAAVDATTGAVEAWDPNANSFHGIYTISTDTNSVALGGYFTKVSGFWQQGDAIFTTNLPSSGS